MTTLFQNELEAAFSELEVALNSACVYGNVKALVRNTQRNTDHMGFSDEAEFLSVTLKSITTFLINQDYENKNNYGQAVMQTSSEGTLMSFITPELSALVHSVYNDAVSV